MKRELFAAIMLLFTVSVARAADSDTWKVSDFYTLLQALNQNKNIVLTQSIDASGEKNLGYL